MKKLTSFLFLSLCLVSFPLTTGMTCSKSQQTITYNTLYSVIGSVNTAYIAYNDEVVAGKVKFSPNVAKIYADFQAAALVAINSAQTINAPAPQNLVDLANSLYAAINQLKK